MNELIITQVGSSPFCQIVCPDKYWSNKSNKFTDVIDSSGISAISMPACSRMCGKLHGMPVEKIMLQVAFLIESYSQTAYDILRNCLPLPDRSMIRHSFHRLPGIRFHSDI
jgi:hypothetical protein